LWIRRANILTHDEATALVARMKSGDTAAADQSALRSRMRELAAPFEKLRDHAPDDPAFLLEHLSRSVFEAGINRRVVEVKWDGIREAFHGFDPAQVAVMPSAEITAVENDSRVIRNKAKIGRRWRTRAESSPYSMSTAASGAISRPSRMRARRPQTCGGASSSSATPACGGS
jgi:hypothetical protein